MSDIEHTVTFDIPSSMWPTASKGLRQLREILRDAGGTTRMTRSGNHITITAEGPHMSVLNLVESVAKIEKMVTDTRKGIIDGLRKEMGHPESRSPRVRKTMDGLLEMAADVLIESRGK